ncbi:hypothetical protein ACFQ0B_66565 [Nonomuraea thailandensis]
MRSASRLSSVSIQPPRYPASMPSAAPTMTVPSATTSGPARAVRAPTMTWDSTSAPSWSVPSQWAPLGPETLSSRSWTVGS